MAKQWHQLEKLDHKSLKKLQADRDKVVVQQKKEADRKNIMLIGGSILFAIAIIIFFISMVMQRSAERANQAARAEFYKQKVLDAGGAAFFRSIGDWQPLKKGMIFDTDHTFKTEKEGFIVIELQLKNQVKLASNSEMVVFKPSLHEKENKVTKEKVKLTRGEVTVSISMEGRELLEVESSGVTSIGASGLYKMLYNEMKRTGEVVVKHGLVEVIGNQTETGSSKNPATKRVKVSGFYKVTYANSQVSNPTQASVIQYDWR
ncbi:MAG: FecR domain-containing protein [Candidatus Riflebacteria bacterium]|nr:FecR domain-containing protein [Candidatus Riflebacteria bacterium]